MAGASFVTGFHMAIRIGLAPAWGAYPNTSLKKHWKNMSENISRQDWLDHIAEDDRRGADVNELKMAMFGNPEVPDTVKQAVMPTMTRLNTYLDGILLLCKGILALLAGGAAMIAIAKGVGWM